VATDDPTTRTVGLLQFSTIRERACGVGPTVSGAMCQTRNEAVAARAASMAVTPLRIVVRPLSRRPRMIGTRRRLRQRTAITWLIALSRPASHYAAQGQEGNGASIPITHRCPRRSLATGCVGGTGDAFGVYVSVLPAAGSAACAATLLVDVGVIEVMGEVLPSGVLSVDPMAVKPPARQ
jgi:hypothetical protein